MAPVYHVGDVEPAPGETGELVLVGEIGAEGDSVGSTGQFLITCFAFLELFLLAGLLAYFEKMLVECRKERSTFEL